MNILIITNMYPTEEFPYSGIFVKNQVKAIQDLLEENESLSFYYMKTHNIGSKVKYIKFAINFLIYCYKQYKYDIIHVHYYFPTIFLAVMYKLFFNRNVKIVVTFHGSDIYKWDFNFWYKYPLKFVDLCIGVSSLITSKIKEIYKGNTVTISAGALESFHKKKTEKVYDIAFIGSLINIKGFDIFLKAINKSTKKLKILIIGNGSLDYLINSIDTDRHVIDYHRHIEQDKLIDYYNKVKFLINSSRNEAFGLSITEAMMCGIPVIATRTDGSIEQIIPNNNGLIIESDIEESSLIDSLCTSIDYALSIPYDEYEKLSNFALESSKKYSIVEVAKQLKALYKSLL